MPGERWYRDFSKNGLNFASSLIKIYIRGAFRIDDLVDNSFFSFQYMKPLG